MLNQEFRYQVAIQDFRWARRQVALEQILAFLKGESANLLSYEDVRKKLKMKGFTYRGLMDIPLDAIVGSVGRYQDFTRSFLPKNDSDEPRWATVQTVITGMGGLSPIEVYKIGEAYFVADGNHRVSIARQLGTQTIEAYVTEVHTRVPITPDIQPDELIIKAGYADFLEATHLDELRPEANLQLTVPGKYQLLKKQITHHHHQMEVQQQRKIPFPEAAADWYDHAYLPVVTIIRERGLLRDFPERTETDFYLWIVEHRAELEQQLGWQVSSDAAASDLLHQFSSKPDQFISRVAEKLYDALTPDELESGPSIGQWRKEEVATRRDDRLFTAILVPVNGHETGWYALDQALELARHEDGQLYGLHVVPSEFERDGKFASMVKVEFERRCQAAGVPGNLAIDVGEPARKICERARWTDLVVLNLAYPPQPQPVAKLKSGFHTIIRRCPRPILAVPKPATPITRALLAYDGSPKANEALFIGAYLAGHLKIPLVVVTVTSNGQSEADMPSVAQQSLSKYDIKATFVSKTGAASQAILDTTEEHACDLLIMGGYGRGAMMEVMFGSTLDQILISKRFPVLICR